MKILHIIEQLNIGGAEKDLINKATYLSFYDVQNYIFCFYKKGYLANYINDKIEIIYNNHNHKLYSVIKEALYLNNIIKQIKPDIIHTHLYSSELMISINKLLFNNPIPCISSVQSLISQVKKGKKFIKILFNFLIKKYYDKFIACSGAVKNELISYNFNQNKIEIIYNAVNVNEYLESQSYTSNTSHQYPTIGFIGRLEPYKGAHILIKAMPSVINKFKNMQLWIIGDGHEKDKLLKLTHKLNLTNNVKFLGAQLNIKEYLLKLSVLIVPSLSEPLGIVALEGLAMKLPVIATNIDGLKEIIIDNQTGFLIQSNNSDSLANKLIFVLDNYQLAKKIAEQGHEFIKQQFNINILAEKQLMLYKSLIAK